MTKCNLTALELKSQLHPGKRTTKMTVKLLLKKNCYYTENHLFLKCHVDVMKFKVDPAQFTAVNILKAQ